MSDGTKGTTLERNIWAAVERLRKGGNGKKARTIWGVTADAVVDKDEVTERTHFDHETGARVTEKTSGPDGKLDSNPETGPGQEPGKEWLNVDGVTFTEDDFANCTTSEECEATIELALESLGK